MILSGDVGGTRTRLGLFDETPGRPRAVLTQEYPTRSFSRLEDMLTDFLDRAGHRQVAGACFGVAGPVSSNAATLTNVPWRVDGREVGRVLNIACVTILNDLQAMACSVPVLADAELHVLQEGVRAPDGNMALVAAGTGLGESLLHFVDGRYIPSPMEAGHADFAARTDREVALLEDLTRRFGRASVEHVLSGPGLVNVHRVTHATPCLAIESTESPNAAAAISEAALTHRCPGCIAALEMFVDAYGAEAGNLALRSLATGGLYIGGGIARRILPALTGGRFMATFTAKTPFDALLRNVPVKVILIDESALLGAAVYAAQNS